LNGKNRRSFGRSNINATRTITSLLGVLVGISGISHGIFEALQGNRGTNGFVIFAVGKGSIWTRWTNGSEGAFTLIPNFLITDIFAVIAGALLAVWSFRFINAKWGSSFFLLIGTILFLVGGGVAQVPFIVLTWAVATRINKSLRWWKTNMSANIRRTLAKIWLWLLTVSSLMFLLALEIAVFGFLPYVSDLSLLLIVDWSILAVAAIFLIMSILAGFAHDIENQVNLRQMDFSK
jgi:hypothetical protein